MGVPRRLCVCRAGFCRPSTSPPGAGRSTFTVGVALSPAGVQRRRSPCLNPTPSWEGGFRTWLCVGPLQAGATPAAPEELVPVFALREFQPVRWGRSFLVPVCKNAFIIGIFHLNSCSGRFLVYFLKWKMFQNNFSVQVVKAVQRIAVCLLCTAPHFCPLS